MSKSITGTVVSRLRERLQQLCPPVEAAIASGIRSTTAGVGHKIENRKNDNDNNIKNQIGGIVANFVHGQLTVPPLRETKLAVRNPSSGEIIGWVPEPSESETAAAVASAKQAFHEWSGWPLDDRLRLLRELHKRIGNETDDLAALISLEQGKTIADARGEISRGLSAVQHAFMRAPFHVNAGVASRRPLSSGGAHTDRCGKSIYVTSVNHPLGVCVGISPLNFPAMIPLWMFPIALAAGNTFVLKPSVRTPLTGLWLAMLANEVGLPPGCVNVLNGDRVAVEALCKSPDVKAVTFVGGNIAGTKVYEMASSHGKRVQCNMGAKNHAILMPDADENFAVTSVCNAAFGAAGQRCMAISVAILVGGDAAKLESRFAETARKFRVGPSNDESVDYGPMITEDALRRAERLCMETIKNKRGRLLCGGSRCKLPENQNGYFMSPTIVADVQLNAPVYREEIFAPVLSIVNVATLDEAIGIINQNPYGNGAAIFTQNGAAARRFEEEVRVGMLGVNVPIPVPPPEYCFSGWNQSFYGSTYLNGDAGFQFYLQPKTVMARWPIGEPQTTTHNSSEPSGVETVRGFVTGVFPHH